MSLGPDFLDNLQAIRQLLTNGTAQQLAANLDLASGFTFTSTTDANGVTTLHVTSPGTLAHVCTPEMFGAVGDGTTDDTAAFTAALAAMTAGTYGVLALAARTYLISATLTLPATCSIKGQGDASQIKTNTNTPMLKAGGDYTVFEDFRLVGNSTAALQNGIDTNNFSFVRISNITIGPFMGNDGIRLTGNSAANIGPIVVNCRVQNANQNAFNINGAQYAQIADSASYGCGIGIHIGAGNALITNCNFSLDTVGANITTGDGNDAHCVFAGCYFNHSVTHAITVGAIVNGAFFRGCNIYYVDIVLTTSIGVIFEGCTIDVTDIYHDGSTGTQFVDCTWPMANANTQHFSYNAHASTQMFTPGNRKLDGTVYLATAPRVLDMESGQPLNMQFGGTIRAQIEGSHGVGIFGNGGSDYAVHAGPLTGFETSYAAIWVLSQGTGRTASNCVAYSTGNSGVNWTTPSGVGSHSFYYGAGTLALTLNGTKLLGTSNGDFATAKRFANTSSALALVNGANNNVAVASSFLRITGPTGAFSITGFVQPVDSSPAIIDGTRLTIYNTTAFAMTIANSNAGSSVGNRILTLTGADVVLAARTTSAQFIYSATDTAWIYLGTS